MNLPNKISVARIILVPIVITLYLLAILVDGLEYFKLISLGLLIVSEATDFLDGYLARKNNQVTDLGKFLDPIADKVLTLSTLLLVVVDFTLPFPYGVIAYFIILARELIISSFRQIAATKNVVMAADKLGKLKTIFLDIAIPGLFLLSYLNTTNLDLFRTIVMYISYIFMGLSVLLTIISGINYLIKNKNVLK